MNNKDVFISKRALKHFVESRSAELIEKYDVEYILYRLHIIIDNIENVLNSYTSFETINNRHYFLKNISTIDVSSIRIVLEFIGDHFEIVTMHYKKLKTLPDNE